LTFFTVESEEDTEDDGEVDTADDAGAFSDISNCRSSTFESSTPSNSDEPARRGGGFKAVAALGRLVTVGVGCNGEEAAFEGKSGNDFSKI
jgi:hypothetical protein